MEEIKDGMSGEQQVLELGIMVGERRAFGMVAGRCSAAQAECLRKIREEKTYLKFAPNWSKFCEGHLKISPRTADRTIALLKKHGTLYFETAALTGISSRRLTPAGTGAPTNMISIDARRTQSSSSSIRQWVPPTA